jgi:cytochrome P450
MSTQNGIGPIIRIRPEVLHVNDPEFIDQLFGSAGKRRDKYKIATNGFAAHKASLGTIKHELHRSRRGALNPFFSKQSIRRLEPILQRTLAKVLRNLSAAAKSGESMRMNLLYSAATSDIIYDYCFGQSANNLDRADLNEQFFSVFHEASKGYHFACFNPWLVPVMKKLPIKVMAVLMPGTEVFLELVVASQYSCFISLDKVLILAVLNQEDRRGQRIPQDEHRRGYGTDYLSRIAQ